MKKNIIDEVRKEYGCEKPCKAFKDCVYGIGNENAWDAYECSADVFANGYAKGLSKCQQKTEPTQLISNELKATEMFPDVENMMCLCKGVREKLVEMAEWKDKHYAAMEAKKVEAVLNAVRIVLDGWNKTLSQYGIKLSSLDDVIRKAFENCQNN